MKFPNNAFPGNTHGRKDGLIRIEGVTLTIAQLITHANQERKDVLHKIARLRRGGKPVTWAALGCVPYPTTTLKGNP